MRGRRDKHHHYEVACAGDKVVAAGLHRPLNDVVDIRVGLFSSNVIVLAYDDEQGAAQVLAGLDGQGLSNEVAGGFLGRIVGIYAVAEDAAFDWFDYEATNTVS